MRVFHVFEIVEMTSNRAKQLEKKSDHSHILLLLLSEFKRIN